jgi:hypothetical protein
MYVLWILIECVICLGVICVCHRFGPTGEEAQIAALQARRDVLRDHVIVSNHDKVDNHSWLNCLALPFPMNFTTRVTSALIKLSYRVTHPLHTQEYLSGIAAIDKELMRIYQGTDGIMEADF